MPGRANKFVMSSVFSAAEPTRTAWSRRPQHWGPESLYLGLLSLACGCSGDANGKPVEEERVQSSDSADTEGQTLGEICADSPEEPVCEILNPVPQSSSFARVENASAEPYDRVDLDWPEASMEFGALRPGERSDYAELLIAYNYAATLIRAADGFYRYQPTDFAGEGIDRAGYFTYKLTLRREGETGFRRIDDVPVVGYVDIELVVDRLLD